MNPQDEIYIATLKEQINGGMYDHLFRTSVNATLGRVRKDLVFLDIGANIGLVSVYAVPYCKHIVSVEPSHDTFQRLVENTRHYPIIECLNFALTPSDGMHEFFENDVNFTASSTVNTYGKKTSVGGRTLSSLLKYVRHVDICKIDAEGAEGEALNLSQLEAASSIISTYYIETHNCPKTTWEHKLGTLVGNLARCGYTEMEISGMSVTATKP